MAHGAEAEFMRRAIALAIENVRSGAGGPFAAVIVRDGKIIAEAANSVTSTCDPTAHGEVNAIRAACRALGTFSLAGCVIYSSCEPCPMCLAAIYWARLDRIWFANTRTDAAQIQFDDDWLYREVALPLEQRRLPIAELMRDEALAVFRAWDAKPDKIRY